MLTSLSVTDLLNEIASSSPAPGALNVLINLNSMQDETFVEAKRTIANTIRTSVSDDSQHILYRINENIF